MAGCAVAGEPLHDWKLDFEAKHDVPVRLPSNLLEFMPPTGPVFTLRTHVATRGEALTLVLPCYHSEIHLRVDGREVHDDGDTGVGEHRFAIPAELTNSGRIELALSAPRDMISFGFTVEPHLVEGTADRLATAWWNRAAATLEMILIGAFSLLFGIVFLLDRRRRAEGAFALQAIAAIVSPLWSIGVVGDVAGDAMPAVLGISLCGVNAALLAYVHYAFELGRPSRIWMGMWASLAACYALSTTSMWLSIMTTLVAGVLGTAFGAYIVVKLWIVRRTPAYRLDAILLLIAQAIAIINSTIDLVQIATAHNIMGGFHTATLGILAWALAQAIVLARHNAAHRRQLEQLNVELQRQVAERSRELAEAFTKLSE